MAAVVLDVKDDVAGKHRGVAGGAGAMAGGAAGGGAATFEESRMNSIKGLSYMAVSAFLFSVMTLLVKVAGNSGVPPIHVVGVRLGCQAMLAAVAGGCYFRINPFGPPAKRRLLWLRGFAGSTSVALFFWGLTKLPLSDATVLFFTNPIVAAIVARFVLGEKWGYFEAGAALVSLLGVTFISRPQFIFGPPPLPEGVTLSEEVEMEVSDTLPPPLTPLVLLVWPHPFGDPVRSCVVRR